MELSNKLEDACKQFGKTHQNRETRVKNPEPHKTTCHIIGSDDGEYRSIIEANDADNHVVVKATRSNKPHDITTSADLSHWSKKADVEIKARDGYIKMTQDVDGIKVNEVQAR